MGCLSQSCDGMSSDDLQSEIGDTDNEGVKTWAIKAIQAQRKDGKIVFVKQQSVFNSIQGIVKFYFAVRYSHNKSAQPYFGSKVLPISKTQEDTRKSWMETELKCRSSG